MQHSANFLDKRYLTWVAELSKRYRNSQLKAAVKVNSEMLRFYFELGRDIVERKAENSYGSGFYAALSRDLGRELPGAKGLSERNLRYTKRFYLLYSGSVKTLQQPAAKSGKAASGVVMPDSAARQASERIMNDIVSVPWGHHMLLIDKFQEDPEKALFYVRLTVENGFSRSSLLNAISMNVCERQGKALTNFSRTLPGGVGDLAQELTKDPYCFAFTEMTEPYNERMLKSSLLDNITRFLVELGTGFAYVGKEFRLQIGEAENFIDLLFYNLRLSCFVVVEVKIGKFSFADVGQLGGYVVACNHQMRKAGRDNPTIGLLICREKDRIQAQYALESSSQPLGISEYDLERFYPEKVEGTLPSIEEIEMRLNANGELN